MQVLEQVVSEEQMAKQASDFSSASSLTKLPRRSFRAGLEYDVVRMKGLRGKALLEHAYPARPNGL